MDFNARCSKGCGHFVWEHEIGGAEQRACRYCPCVLQPIAGEQWRLPVRSTGVFRAKPSWIKPHPIYGSGLGFAEVTGAGAEGIFIMAEALGEDEERASKPLVGPTGRNTARMIARIPDPADPSRRLDIDRDFWRSNIIPFKPPFNKIDSFNWQERSWLFELCKPHWEAELTAKKPRAILALGDHALWALTGRRGITKVRGAVCETPYGPVIPTYHPAYIMRGKIHLTKIWQTDLRRALFVARHGVPKYETAYRLNPTIQDVEAFYNEWVAAGRPPISFDIETPYSNDKDEDPLGGDDAADSDKPISEDSTYNILEIGFCFGARSGINMPWAGAFREWALRILAEAKTLFSWNGYSFDGPRLAADGAILGGDHVDLMLCLHGKSWLRLPDGSRQRVQDAVATGVKQLVGVDAAGRLKTVNVVRWRNRQVGKQRWLRIYNDSSRHPIVCTPEHLVLTGDGWKRADAVVVGDVVLGPKAGSDDLIHGALLGDGYFSSGPRSLCITHSPEQAEWFHAKREHLGNPTFGEYPNGAGHRRLVLQTVASRKWERLQRPGGKHFVPPTSPASVAVWWSDDGSLSSRLGKRVERTSFRGVLPVHSFDNREAVWTWAAKTFGTKGLTRCATKSPGFVIYFTGAALRRLCEMVAPFTVPSMQYKLLPEFNGRYNGWLEQQVPRRALVRKIEEFEEREAVRYCADVDEPTHAFATEGGLVHNCWHLLEPALPMGLKPTATMFYIDVPAAWACKDMADKRSPDYNPRLYNVLDVDFTLRLGLQLVERAKAEGKWEVFKRQYVQLDRVLRAASRKGVRTNPTIRAEARVKFEARFLELVAELQAHVPLDILPRQTYVGSEEKLRAPRTRLGETLLPIWEEGRMVEVEVLVKPPKPKKKTWRVFYMKALKAGPAEKSKQIKAFSAEEAQAAVPGALRAEEVLSEPSS